MSEAVIPDSRSTPRPVYLDCNATTPIDPRVLEAVIRFSAEEFGNAGSRTHVFGARARLACEGARSAIASLVDAESEDVVFTSGATESNNLALMGLAAFGEQSGRKHIISTEIEHKSVLKPLEALSRRGFDVELVRPVSGGWVEAEAIVERVRPETLLVSVMQVNNETGVFQPIEEIAAGLSGLDAYFHVDAAQGFGRRLEGLREKRLDLISVSAHKIYGPKGIGALIARRLDRLPLSPLFYGGGQEGGMRPGTLPVQLVVGFGVAASTAERERTEREMCCQRFRRRLLEALTPLAPVRNGEEDRCMPHVLNVSFPGVDAEEVIDAVGDLIAISNGSACASQSLSASHVVRAMGRAEEVVRGAVRFSWCHMTEDVEWEKVVQRIGQLQ
jgi:cysteine desulfurase